MTPPTEPGPREPLRDWPRPRDAATGLAPGPATPPAEPAPAIRPTRPGTQTPTFNIEI